MRTYFTTGTIGDVYIILCKLYRIAMKEEILCKHYTEHKKVWPAIKEIFSLSSNIHVEFLETKIPAKYIHGGFYYAGHPDSMEEAEFYPIFDLPDPKYFNLPKIYKIIQMKSGFNFNRELKSEIASQILNSSNLPIVAVGEDSVAISSNKYEIIDLRNKTTIREVIAIIRNSHQFYGPPGFLSFVALSQKVPSTIYLRTRSDKSAVWGRIEVIPEWKRFYTAKEII